MVLCHRPGAIIPLATERLDETEKVPIPLLLYEWQYKSGRCGYVMDLSFIVVYFPHENLNTGSTPNPGSKFSPNYRLKETELGLFASLPEASAGARRPERSGGTWI